MKYNVNFQYRPKDKPRPEDETMLDVSGRALDIEFQDSGLIPNIGDHVVFCRAGSKGVEQVEGVVENRLFFFFTRGHVGVNIVVTDSETNSGQLIKE